jgi:hypothetical protein
MTASAVWLGVVVNRAREQREALKTIEAMGADVHYEYCHIGDGTTSRLLKAIYGDVNGLRRIEITVWQGERRLTEGWLFSAEAYSGYRRPFEPTMAFDDGGLKAIGTLPMVEYVCIRNVPVTDAGVVHLASCGRLQRLVLIGTAVSDAGVAQLQERLPHCEIFIAASAE